MPTLLSKGGLQLNTDDKMALIIRYILKHQKLGKTDKVIRLIGYSLEHSNASIDDAILAQKLLTLTIGGDLEC